MSPSTIVYQRKPAPGVPGRECRVWQRHACDLQTACQPIAARLDKDVMWQATVCDISACGVGLVLRRRFEPGAGLAIEIPETDTRPGDTLLVKVVRVTPRPDGSWLMGCGFVSELGEDELEALLQLAHAQHAAPAPPPAKSGVPARPPEAATILRLNGSAPVAVPRIELVGLSRSGAPVQVEVRSLVLSGTWPAAAGTILRVRSANRAAQLPAVRIQINRCTLKGSRWSLDYQFVDPPTPEFRRLFGYRDEA
jgi:hypothetical protein